MHACWTLEVRWLRNLCGCRHPFSRAVGINADVATVVFLTFHFTICLCSRGALHPRVNKSHSLRPFYNSLGSGWEDDYSPNVSFKLEYTNRKTRHCVLKSKIAHRQKRNKNFIYLILYIVLFLSAHYSNFLKIWLHMKWAWKKWHFSAFYYLN